MKIKDIIGNNPIIKMHGCGNDFVILFDMNEKITPEIAKKFCDRHYGIGADGLVTITKSRIKEAKFRMKFFNPDGSLAQMCGNGIRCFAKYLLDLNLIEKEKEIAFDTDKGIVFCTTIENNKRRALVKVNMGEPIFYDPKQINLKPKNNEIIKGKTNNLDFTFVSMGNPHAVIFSDTPETDVKKFGPLIENDTTIFPQKTNVEFIKVNSPNDITMYVWERGAGETLACGTGACASFVTAVISGFCSKKATVHLLGGDLIIEWMGIGNPIYMTGEAVNIFKIDADSIDEFLL